MYFFSGLNRFFRSNQIKSNRGRTFSDRRWTLHNRGQPCRTMKSPLKPSKSDVTLSDVRSSSPATGKGGGNSLPVTLSQPQSPAIRIGMNKKHLFCPFFFAIFTVFVNFSARRFYMFFFFVCGAEGATCFLSLSFSSLLGHGFCSWTENQPFGKNSLLFSFVGRRCSTQKPDLFEQFLCRQRGWRKRTCRAVLLLSAVVCSGLIFDLMKERNARWLEMALFI